MTKAAPGTAPPIPAQTYPDVYADAWPSCVSWWMDGLLGVLLMLPASLVA